MSEYRVTYHYLTTGIKHQNKKTDYGIVSAKSSEEACLKIAKQLDPKDNAGLNSLLSCLHAELIKESSPSYKSNTIMKGSKKQIKCCRHKNIVPLEIGVANKTWPNGYKADPYYNFAVSLVGGNVIRVKAYLCLDCMMEIKAPEPGSLKKDRL